MADVTNPEPPQRGGLYDLGALFHQLVSLTAHAAFIVAAAFVSPPLDVTEDAAHTEEAIHMLAQRFVTVAERDREPVADRADQDPDGRERVASRCGAQDGGSSGDRESLDTDLRYGVEGPPDNPDPHIGREAAYPVGPWFFPGYTAPVPPWGSDPKAPTAPWGRDDSLGNDPASARAGMWGNAIRAAFGSPGVGIGAKRLCETCGDSGHGVELDLTSPGGATDTESTLLARSGYVLPPAEGS